MIAPIKRHDLKGYIAAHFQRLELTTSYRHELYPDQYFFEGDDSFETIRERMMTHNLCTNMLASLGQDPELERLEWRKKCFLEDPNERKKLEEAGDKTKTNDSSEKQPTISKDSTTSKSKYSDLGESHHQGLAQAQSRLRAPKPELQKKFLCRVLKHESWETLLCQYYSPQNFLKNKYWRKQYRSANTIVIVAGWLWSSRPLREIKLSWKEQKDC